MSSLVSPGLLTGQAFLYNHTIFLTPKFNFMYKFTQRIFLFLMLGISVNSFAQSNTLTSGIYKQNFDAIGDNANAALPTGRAGCPEERHRVRHPASRIAVPAGRKS